MSVGVWNQTIELHRPRPKCVVTRLGCFRVLEKVFSVSTNGMNTVKPAGVSVDIGEIKGTGGDTHWHASEYM